MAAEPLTAEAILVATEDVLRRYGPAKATVVDVARALGVSHGSVYRHFPTKAALRAAVAERWLGRVHSALSEIAVSDEPAPVRVRRWLATLFEGKRRKVLDDPELFQTYSVLAGENSAVVVGHVEELIGQLAQIIGDGVERGEFAGPLTEHGSEALARAVFTATDAFHKPAHAGEWSAPDIDARFDLVCSLILAGLGAAVTEDGEVAGAL